MANRIKGAIQKISSEKIEVLGAGLRMHTSMSSVLKYQVLSKYDFDYVILYHGINDLWANHARPWRFSENYGHMNAWYIRGPWLDNSLIVRSLFNKYFAPKMVHFFNPKARRHNASAFASEKTFQRNLEKIIADVKSDGASPILMTFAWSIPEHYSEKAFEAGQSGYAKPSNIHRYSVELWGKPDFVEEGLNRHNRVVRELANRENTLLIDQERLMRKDLRWYNDVCHFGEEGTDKFIDNIVKFFKDNQLLTVLRLK